MFENRQEKMMLLKLGWVGLFMTLSAGNWARQDWVAFMSQPYWVVVMVEVELRLIWTWSWNKVEMRLSGSLVEIELSWSWDKLTLNKGRNWAFIGVGLWFKICFRSTYVAEQLLFSMLLLISYS